MIFQYFQRSKGLLSNYDQYCKLASNIRRWFTFQSVKDIYLSKESAGKKAEVKGWVKAVRKMKENIFIDINDGSWPTHLQVIIPKQNVPEGLTYGSSIETSGQLVLNQSNRLELVPESLRMIGPCIVTDGYPFAPRKYYHPDYIRQFIHLRPRTQTYSSLLRVRHHAARALDDYFNNLQFIKVDVPILTSNDCEGAGEVFKVWPENQNLLKEMASPNHNLEEAFFKGKAYLTVSGQFHLEAAARAVGKVYCFGPTFRAENSKSRLHLSEFYMAEAEVAFAKTLDDILKLNEELVKSILKYLMDNCAEDLYLNAKLQKSDTPLNVEHLLLNPFSVETYDNVCNILENHGSGFMQPFSRGHALGKEHELFLVKHNNNIPMFVIDWPAAIKPFYVKSLDTNPSKVHAVDLLCPNVGELCGGSLREDHYDVLQSKLKDNNLEEQLAWYLELRKFGNVPTGGFGLGFERLIQVILGIPNIKDAIPFPRWPHNCKL